LKQRKNTIGREIEGATFGMDKRAGVNRNYPIVAVPCSAYSFIVKSSPFLSPKML
jgi:hypothetical protein